MGQKSNIITLREHNKNLSFLENEKESKKFLYGLNFCRNFENLLIRKGMVLTDRTMHFVNNHCYLNLSVFYRTSKISTYKKKISKNYNRGKNLKNFRLNSLFFSPFKILKNNLTFLKFDNINQKLNTSHVRFIYQKIGRFSGVLFSRRFTLLIDFIKVCSLFSEGKISSKIFLSFLGQIFRVLPKRKHNRFLFFLKYLFQILLENNEIKNLSSLSNIIGIKFIVNGKLQGKTRADSSCIQVGAVPIQTISKNIDYSMSHVYTLYGAFGFRIWVCRKSI
jgi:Ribosomal protein S3, C-terminal domain